MCYWDTEVFVVVAVVFPQSQKSFPRWSHVFAAVRSQTPLVSSQDARRSEETKELVAKFARWCAVNVVKQ